MRVLYLYRRKKHLELPFLRPSFLDPFYFLNRARVFTRMLIAGAIPLILYATATSPAFAKGTVDLLYNRKTDNWASNIKNLPCGPFRLDIGGNLRLRYEYQKALDVRGYSPDVKDGLLLTRIMLDFNLQINQQTRLLLQLRDARTAGSRLGRSDFLRNNPIEDGCDVRQAFIEWLHIGESPIGIKAGRQQISYGDQRVFGPGLWGNTGRYVWDAAMLKADMSFLLLDLWTGRYIENRPDRWPNRTFRNPTTYVAYGSIKKIPAALDFFHAIKHDGSGNVSGEKGCGNLQSYSSGIQTRGKIRRNIDYTATFVYQFGEYGNDDIRAYGANTGIGITEFIPWKTRLAAQFTLGSGDNDPYDGIHETFDGVFGGADINFYGDLNLFYWANLRDYELDMHLTPLEQIRVMLEYHYFVLDKSRDAWYTTGLKPLRRDTSGNAGTSLGHELNFRFVYSPVKALEIMFGYGHFFPGSYVRNTGNDKQANGIFLQCTSSI